MNIYSSPSTKLVAVAKNEAFAIPQWVFHHFYIGFDAIDIYVNRTSDNSMEVLKKLKDLYPELNYYSSDWVDTIPWPPLMQYTVYSYAYYNESACEYIMSMDLDEFLVPRLNGATIGECLRDLGRPDMISFEWLGIDGRNELEFPLFTAPAYMGRLARLGKSIVRRGLKIPKVELHIQHSDEIKTSLLADGQIRQDAPNINHFNTSQLGSLKPWFIIHDWYRSPLFHLANIANGDALIMPSKKGNEALKTNKIGYNTFKSHWFNKRCKFQFPDNYWGSFQNAILKSRIGSDLELGVLFRLLLALSGANQLECEQNTELRKKIFISDYLFEDIKDKICKQINLITKENKIDIPNSSYSLNPTNISEVFTQIKCVAGLGGEFSIQ